MVYNPGWGQEVSSQGVITQVETGDEINENPSFEGV
jgi:hypothetical protein